MSRKTSPKTVRVTIDLTPELYERLSALQQVLGRSSKADVVRDALGLYGELITGQQSGTAFGQREADGEWVRVRLFPHLLDSTP